MKNIFSILLLLSFISNLNGQNNVISTIKTMSEKKFTYFNADHAHKLKDYLDDKLVFIHSNGMTESKEEMIKNLLDKKWGLEKVNITQSDVRLLSKKVAVLIGKGIYFVKLEKEVIEMELYYTEVWTKYKSGWKLSSRHANRMK